MSATFLLGLPGKVKSLITSLAAVESKIDTVDTVVDDILVDTATIDSRTATMATNITTVDSVVDAIEVDTTEIQADLNGIIAGTTAVPGTIKSIQWGVSSLGSEDFQDDKTITAVVLAKSTAIILSVSMSTIYTSGAIGTPTISLTSTTNVRVTRLSTTGDDRPITVYWVVIERN